MMDAIKEELASLVFNVEVSVEGNSSGAAPSITAKGVSEKPVQAMPLQYRGADENGSTVSGDVSRNSPCPCGSGKKFKRCHGAA
jgi:preprotein translocase subunit SecA